VHLLDFIFVVVFHCVLAGGNGEVQHYGKEARLLELAAPTRIVVIVVVLQVGTASRRQLRLNRKSFNYCMT